MLIIFSMGDTDTVAGGQCGGRCATAVIKLVSNASKSFSSFTIFTHWTTRNFFKLRKFEKIESFCLKFFTSACLCYILIEHEEIFEKEFHSLVNCERDTKQKIIFSQYRYCLLQPQNVIPELSFQFVSMLIHVVNVDSAVFMAILARLLDCWKMQYRSS